MPAPGDNVFAELLSRAGLNRDVAFFERAKPLHLRRIAEITDAERPRMAVSEQRFTIDAPFERVWEAYRATPLSAVWPRERIFLRAIYLPGSDAKHEGEWPGLVVGMRVFSDLRVRPFHHLLRVMVGVEVTKVSPEEIRYDYLEGSVTRGHNSIHLERHGASTHVRHFSLYRGATASLRATFPVFQPILHVGFVNAIHRGMKKRIEAEAEADAVSLG